MLLNIIMCVLLAFYICHTLFTFDICDTELLQLIVLVVVLIL
jgi:hypothetical protein